MVFTYDYPRPALSVDMVVFGFNRTQLQVLLIERLQPVGDAKWALPGGFVEMDETVEQAAARELQEETGLTRVRLEQLHTFSALQRDPRERVVSVSFYGMMALNSGQVARADSDAKSVYWCPLQDVPKLCFDHHAILVAAQLRLREKMQCGFFAFDLLPKKFTINELQLLYEQVLQRSIDKGSFRNKVLSSNFLEPLDEFQKTAAQRRARLYRFNSKRYRSLKNERFRWQFF